MNLQPAPCVLCDTDGGVLVYRSDVWRVVRVDDTPSHPVFYRLIWNSHVAEFSDLSDADRQQCMAALATVERTIRQGLQAAGVAARKINLASLGNMVPHLHWHVVARFDTDAHFPAPIWAQPARPDDAAQLLRLAQVLPTLDAALQSALTTNRN